MIYIVKVTLNDSSSDTFEYPAIDTVSAIIAFEDDSSTAAIYAKQHLKEMEVYPKS